MYFEKDKIHKNREIIIITRKGNTAFKNGFSSINSGICGIIERIPPSSSGNAETNSSTKEAIRLITKLNDWDIKIVTSIILSNTTCMLMDCDMPLIWKSE